MPTWLSSFMLNPALAAGAAAVASPILIHLLSRRRFRRIRWAAMDFLLEAQRRNRRRVRLEQLILLILRCLAIFLLALVMTRPFIRPSVLGAVSSAGRTERIILIDDSYSMDYRSPGGAAGGRSVFARAAEAAKYIALAAAEENEADSLTLLTAGSPRQPVVALASLSEANLRQLGDALDAARPTQAAAALPEAIDAVADMIRARPTQASAVVYVISDFQRHDWLAEEGRQDRRSPAETLAALAKGGKGVRLVLVDTAIDPQPSNLAITELRRDQPLVVTGVPTRFELAVANYSPRPVEQVEISIRAGDHTLPPITIPAISAGQLAREPVEVTFADDGSAVLEAKIVGASQLGDGLALDNARLAPVEVVPAVRVLMVSGEPSGDPYNDEVFLLRTALRPEGRAASGNEIDVIDDQELEGADLASYDLVVLANVDRLATVGLRNLESYVRAGGGLVIFCGDQVDAAYYNDALYREGEGLLPGPLGDVQEAAGGAAAITIGDWDAAHPLMRAFIDELASVLRLVKIDAFLKMDEDAAAAASQPAGRPAADGATSSVRPPSRVIVRLSDPDHSPLMIERSFGQGNCLLITTSADQEWNEWAASFSYLPMMLEIVQYAARQAAATPTAVVGAPLTCAMDPTVIQKSARARTPGYPVEAEIPLEAKVEADRAALVFNDTSRCGTYRFEMTSTRGEPISRFGAVNPDPAEANLARASRAELLEVCGELDVQYVTDVAALAEKAASARIEIWWPLLMAAIVLFMTEHVLAWWFGSRG